MGGGDRAGAAHAVAAAIADASFPRLKPAPFTRWRCGCDRGLLASRDATAHVAAMNGDVTFLAALIAGLVSTARTSSYLVTSQARFPSARVHGTSPLRFR